METLKIKEEKEILYVSLARPEVRNAFNPKMIQELTQVFSEVPSKSSFKALVLTGEGKSFSAGADLSWMQSMINFDFAENKKDSENLFKMFLAGYHCSLPIISYVHGHVMGGAIGLVSISDIAIAENDTQFCFSEVKLGLIPAVISPFVLKKMNPAQAKAFMISGMLFNAQQAKEGGLVQITGPSNETKKSLESLLQQLRSCAPQALRETKKLLKEVEKYTSVEDVKNITTEAIAKKRVDSEGQEGLQSFLKKTKPSWQQGTKDDSRN